jgi:hypothetical protein
VRHQQPCPAALPQYGPFRAFCPASRLHQTESDCQTPNTARPLISLPTSLTAFHTREETQEVQPPLQLAAACNTHRGLVQVLLSKVSLSTASRRIAPGLTQSALCCPLDTGQDGPLRAGSTDALAPPRHSTPIRSACFVLLDLPVRHWSQKAAGFLWSRHVLSRHETAVRRCR